MTSENCYLGLHALSIVLGKEIKYMGRREKRLVKEHVVYLSKRSLIVGKISVGKVTQYGNGIWDTAQSALLSIFKSKLVTQLLEVTKLPDLTHHKLKSL